MTNEDRKAESKNKKRDKGRYYKGAICNLGSETAHKHTHTPGTSCQRQVTSLRSLSVYLSRCDEMLRDGRGERLLFYK